MKVKNLKIREILASTSVKTIEVEIETEKGLSKASVPIGTSRGKNEVNYITAEAAVNKFHIIRRDFRLQTFADQKEVDSLLRMIDKTPNFGEIGGNLALAISSAFLKAFALENNQEVYEFLGGNKIPRPICNIVGGWKGQSDIQEFLLLPVHQKSFLENIVKIAAAYRETGEMLKTVDNTFNFGKNIESAWITRLNFEEILYILTRIANSKLLKIGLDVAASHLWDGELYRYMRNSLDRNEQIGFIEEIVRRYPITYIEDPLEENDFLGFSVITSRLQPRLVCGDDIYATNMQRLKMGFEHRATNAVLIKPSQIGTITDAIEVADKAKKNNMITVMSHRSGETDDNLITHLAVGLNCDYIKIGISGERIVKINEMIRIEDKISGEKTPLIKMK